MECKSCKYFVQSKGHSGTCKKRPFVSTRSGGVQMINGKPRVLVVYWSHKACKDYLKGGADK
jgi:hypothetical protein